MMNVRKFCNVFPRSVVTNDRTPEEPVDEFFFVYCKPAERVVKKQLRVF